MPHPPAPCPPHARNCAYEVRAYRCSPDDLFESARKALQDMGPVTAKVDYQHLTIQAVFRVFLFEDDVHLTILPKNNGSNLLVRSASRMGNGDFGVNRRRVNKLLRYIAYYYHSSE